MGLIRKCDYCHKTCEEDVFFIKIIKYDTPLKKIDDSQISGYDICGVCYSQIMGTIHRIIRENEDI